MSILILSASCANESNSGQESITIKIIDIADGKAVEEGKLIITDTGDEFAVNSESNIISMPYKKATEKNKYPYGYTIITAADGYYPRIDHNLKIGGGDGQLTLELTPRKPFENKSFTEYFHHSSEVEMAEFMNYYNLN
ncbi:hypothetical protein [Sedimentibacter hydroxybenzoicus]|nr:hypothetical protein [Sedimentibacter hydroxybenzoicus]